MTNQDVAVHVVKSDDDLRRRDHGWKRRVIKMHGSISEDGTRWEHAPIIARDDYERYAAEFPRIWAALQATFLTRSFLFIGVSCADPNVDVLLRLARSVYKRDGFSARDRPEHFTLLRRPMQPRERVLHECHVQDLEQSGIGVYEVASFKEIAPFLAKLARRTRDPLVFVAGSDRDSRLDLEPICAALGRRLAETDMHIASLGAMPGKEVSMAFGEALRAEDRYDAKRIKYFYGRHESPPTPPRKRFGTIVFLDADKDDLRRATNRRCARWWSSPAATTPYERPRWRLTMVCRSSQSRARVAAPSKSGTSNAGQCGARWPTPPMETAVELMNCSMILTHRSRPTPPNTS
jgi:hypothetical protein